MNKHREISLQKIHEDAADSELGIIRKATRKLARKAIAAGWDGSLITREDRKRALQQLLKEKGFK